MNYRIEQRGAFEMFGVYGLVSQDLQTAFTSFKWYKKEKDKFNGTYKCICECNPAIHMYKIRVL